MQIKVSTLYVGKILALQFLMSFSRGPKCCTILGPTKTEQKRHSTIVVHTKRGKPKNKRPKLDYFIRLNWCIFFGIDIDASFLWILMGKNGSFFFVNSFVFETQIL